MTINELLSFYRSKIEECQRNGTSDIRYRARVQELLNEQRQALKLEN